MILKNFEIHKINLEKQKNFLFYGDNRALIDETTKNLFSKNLKENIYNYDESEILNNKENFFNQILNTSLFESEKIVIISRISEKILEIFKEVLDKNIKDIIFVLKANQLEKKSKLRKFYEDDKRTICIAFYPDTEITLRKLAIDFFNKKKITISQENINLILNKCNSREHLNNELRKVELLSLDGRKPSIDQIIKIIHLNENHNIYELIDYCLLKNKKKTINILNENNFGTDDTIIIIRTFLSKLKKILKLANEYEINQNMDLTIKNAKPPIFWKEKDNIKKQLNYWSTTKIKNLIFELNRVEIEVKKYNSNSINILTNFIISKTTENINSSL